MKKLLGSTLALAMLVPAGANAELLKNFKMGGSLEVDAISATNVTDLSTKKYDNLNTVQTRLMVKADWDLLDDVHAHVSIDKNDRTYGSGGSQNLNTVESALFVDEAYAKIDKVFGGLDVTIGRQFYGEAGDLVIYFGPKYNLYGLPITALDGGRFDWNGEKVGLTLIGAKMTGSAIGVVDSANVNLGGIDFHVKPMDNLSGAVYVYDKTTINSTPANGVIGNDYLYVAGLKAKATVGAAWLKAEVDKDFGSRRLVAGGAYTATDNYTGWAAKADLGVKLDLAMLGAVTGWAQGGVGSGGATANRSFQAIAGDYRPGTIWGRFGNGASATLASANGGGSPNTANTLSNLVVLGAGVKVTPPALTKLTAGLSWWNYRLQTSNGVPTAQAGNKMLGNEYDLDLTWAHSENVSLSAGVGDFQPGRNLTIASSNSNGGSVSSARMGYADLAIKF